MPYVIIIIIIIVIYNLLVHAEKDEPSNEDCYLSQEDYEITEKFEMVIFF